MYFIVIIAAIDLFATCDLLSFNYQQNLPAMLDLLNTKGLVKMPFQGQKMVLSMKEHGRLEDRSKVTFSYEMWGLPHNELG